MKKLIAIAALSASPWMATPALSAEAAYPTKPVRIVVPYTPGATADILARAMGAVLAERLGQQIIVDNREGAGTTIGTGIAARATPDGYTLLMAPAPFITNPLLYAKVPYDPFRDFVPISLVALVPNVLIAKNPLPVSTVKDLIALAKTQPGRLQYASSGKGTSSHLNTEMLKAMAGIDLLEVPYKSPAQALTDVIGGQVDLNFPSLSAALPNIRAGRVKPLAVSTAKRTPAAPDIPAMAEFVPGYEASGSFGLLAPTRTPAAVLAKLNAEVLAILKQASVQQQLLAQGADVVGSTPEAYTAYMKQSYERWQQLIQKLNLRLD